MLLVSLGRGVATDPTSIQGSHSKLHTRVIARSRDLEEVTLNILSALMLWIPEHTMTVCRGRIGLVNGLLKSS